MENIKICPICGQEFKVEDGAISRTDGADICAYCGVRQALESIGVTDKGEQDHIIDLVKGVTK